MQDDTTNDEDELWNKMMEDVTPLSDQPITIPKKCLKRDSILQSKESASSKKPTTRQPSAPETSPNQRRAKDLDRRTQQRLTRGKIPIEARLDLHGMTQQQAHSQLIPFINKSYENKKRCVVVITGKGQGVLQSKVPQWLDLPPINNMVLKAVQAQPKDGGSGALYVYLRRQR